VDALSDLELLRAIIETQQLVNAEIGDVHRVLQVVTERSQALTGATGAVVELVEGGNMVFRAASGSAARLLGTRLEVATSLSGRCLLEARPLRCDDSETDPRVDSEVYRQVGVRSSILVPLLLPDDECVGVLTVLASEPYHFGADAIELLDAMADIVATSLHHARESAERDEVGLRDSLTGLANRRLLLDRVAVALARTSRSALPISVFFVNLDGFGVVNDNLGHDAGDQVLRSVARSLAATVRPADTVARLGSDEFVVVCEGVDAAHVDELTERLRWSVASAGHGQLPVTASVGVARSYPDESAEAVLARADEDMFLTKRAKVRSIAS
jgi:diguanylate cyclase (GGDEF)-like protein